MTVRFRAGDLQTVQLPDFKLVVDKADRSVSAFVLHDRAYEPHVTAVVSELCRPGMTALDIGANIGYYTMLFHRRVGSTGSVVSFEPNSENLRLILATLQANAADNVEVIPLALDARRGWAHFTSHVGSNGGLIRESAAQFVEGGGWIVPTASLDDLMGDRSVDIIKVDVEGGEARVLAGAQETMRRCRPIVISEFSRDMLTRVSAIDPIEYLKTFSDLDYQLQVIDRETPGRLGPAMSPTQLLTDWEDPLRIEDLLLLPR